MVSQLAVLSYILLHVCVSGYVFIIFPEGHHEIDAQNRIATYKSPFGKLTSFNNVPVELQLHMTDELRAILGTGDILCDAIITTANNETSMNPVPPPKWDRSSAVVKLVHGFHAGRYTIIFYTHREDGVGVLLEQTTFEVRIDYVFAPPESCCVPSTRGISGGGCDAISMGKGSYHHFTFDIRGTKAWNITIGKFCSISTAKLFLARTANHKLNFVTTFPLHQLISPESAHTEEIVHGNSHTVNIGNDVWIGANAVLINNLTIGHGAVIGSDSVVRKSIPPYAIAYGNPAVVVRYRFPPDVIDTLLRMQWWDWADERVLGMARYTTTEEVIRAWEAGEL